MTDCHSPTSLHDLVRRYRLSEDTTGTITLRITDMEMDFVKYLAAFNRTPAAVDAATSLDARERGVGEQVLVDRLELFRENSRRSAGAYRAPHHRRSRRARRVARTSPRSPRCSRTDKWTLVGGLMVQIHSSHYGLGIVRPTNAVDIVLHVETSQGVAAETANALRSLDYELRSAVDPRDTPPTGSSEVPTRST